MKRTERAEGTVNHFCWEVRRRRAFLMVFGVVVVGCGGEASQTKPVTLPVQSASAPPAASATPPGTDMCTSTTGATAAKPCGANEATPVPSGAPKLCGCGLCEPVLSEDTCKVDGDCAPATPCHATACVAAAHAQPRLPNTQCTEILQCNAIEANRCACVTAPGASSGRCAIAPRKK